MKLTANEDLVRMATGDALLGWWSKKYSVENIVAIYSVVCKKYIDFPGSNPKAQNLIRSKFDISKPLEMPGLTTSYKVHTSICVLRLP